MRSLNEAAGAADATRNDVPIFGLSYISDDSGATFTQVTNFNFRFSLGVSELP